MKPNKSIIRTSLDAELDGQDICLEFNRVTVFSHDAHYGADADGNRGMAMDFIDDDYAEQVFVLTFTDGPDGTQETSTPLADLTETQRAAVQALIDDYLEHHEAEVPEPDEPDYDPEDDDTDWRTQEVD